MTCFTQNAAGTVLERHRRVCLQPYGASATVIYTAVAVTYFYMAQPYCNTLCMDAGRDRVAPS